MRVREPKSGDVFCLRLPDGTFGLAHVLPRDLMAFYAARFDTCPNVSEVRDLPLGFRVCVGPEYWKDERWERIGSLDLRADLLTPIKQWSCRPDYTGYLSEWRGAEPPRDFGAVSVEQVGDAVPSYLYPETVELWLFRMLEGIPFDPWWEDSARGRAIPWALPLPANFSWEWMRQPQPDTIDAPARDKLKAIRGASDDADSLIAWVPSAGTFINELAYERAVDWPERLEHALGATRRGRKLTIDECGAALAAAFLTGIAAGVALDVSGVPRVVLRQAPRALKPKDRARLAPVAIEALEAIQRPKSEMIELLSESDDFQSFVAEAGRLSEGLSGLTKKR